MKRRTKAIFDLGNYMNQSFRMGDEKAYKLLVNILDSQGFNLFTAKNYNNIGSVDGLLWQVMDREIKPDPYSGSSAINSYDLVHHAFHVLTATKYGESYWGRPKITLLGEALAGCSEIYFEACYLGKNGDYEKSPLFMRYVANSTALGKPFVRVFNKILESPFLGFKETVMDHLKISFTLIEYCKSTIENRRQLPQSVRQKLKNIEKILFLSHKPFASFALYTMTFCGAKSSAEDENSYAECLAILDKSSSMSEFITKMNSAVGYQKRQKVA